MKRFQKDLTIEINQIYHNICRENELFLDFLDANGLCELDLLGKQYYSGTQIFIIKFIINKEIFKISLYPNLIFNLSPIPIFRFLIRAISLISLILSLSSKVSPF